MSKKSKVVSFNGKDITFKELVVSEVRNLLEITPIDYVDALLLSDISLSELAFMANIAVDDLSCATSADLEMLCAAAREVNPLFFEMKVRVVKVAEKMQ
ncbi:hypothetical protein VI06_19855 [Aquitalea magnusonii]|nr:hypothetical protein VI06_19855 [Aquitalea magnusonii]